MRTGLLPRVVASHGASGKQGRGRRSQCVRADVDAASTSQPRPAWKPGTAAIHAGVSRPPAASRSLPPMPPAPARAMPPSREHQPPFPGRQPLPATGERYDRVKTSDALTTPIVQTSTYWFRDTAELIAFQVGGLPPRRAGGPYILARVPRVRPTCRRRAST